MMNSRDDRLRNARRSLWRTTLVWMPLFVAAVGAAIFFFIAEATTDDGYGWVLPSILIVFGTLFGFQGIQAVRDLRGGTAVTSGFITRRWSKFDLGMRTSYLRIEREWIIRIDRVQWMTVDNNDYVEIEYYPASMVGVTVEKKEPPEGSGLAASAPPEPPAPEPDPLLIERE